MPYFVNLSDEDRSEALQSLSEAITAFTNGYHKVFERYPGEDWPIDFGKSIQAYVPRVKGQDRLARVTWAPLRCGLTFYSAKSRLLNKLAIYESFTLPHPFAPPRGKGWVLEKLRQWYAALSVVSSEDDAVSIAKSNLTLTGLVAAAADQYDPNWHYLYRVRGPFGSFPEIVLSFFHDSRIVSQLFSDGSDPRGLGRISRDLQTLLAIHADAYVHVAFAQMGSRRGTVILGHPEPIQIRKPENPLDQMMLYKKVSISADLLKTINARTDWLIR